jgi:hypothetical protein
MGNRRRVVIVQQKNTLQQFFSLFFANHWLRSFCSMPQYLILVTVVLLSW